MTDVALFMNALRAAVPAEPDPRLGADLVPRLAATARASTIEAETRVMRRRSAQRIGAARRRRSRLTSVARVAIAIALIPLVVAGLAVAGVTVPSPARSALDSIGVTLPNQPSQESEQGAAEQSSQPATKGTSEPGKSGTQSKGNSHAAHQHALAQQAKAEAKAIGHTRGKAIGLNELTPSGLSGETGPPLHSNVGGSSGSHSRSHTPPPHPTQVPSGSATAPADTPQGYSR
jgi:cell division protein FtsN